MSLVNEAAVDAADLALAARSVWVAKKFVRAALEAAKPHMAPHIGGEAIRQDKAETWERAQVKYPCVGDLGELLADDAHSTPCPACALKAVAEVLGIEVTG